MMAYKNQDLSLPDLSLPYFVHALASNPTPHTTVNAPKNILEISSYLIQAARKYIEDGYIGSLSIQIREV